MAEQNIEELLELINDLRIDVDYLIRNGINKYQDGCSYKAVVEELIYLEDITYTNKEFKKLLVKLEGKKEYFNLFILKSVQLNVGNIVIFTYEDASKKLTKLKILDE